MKSDRVEVRLMDGSTVHCVDVKPRLFNTWLLDDLGIRGEKRACDLGKALETIHAIACNCDDLNRSLLFKMSLADLLDQYGTSEEMYTGFNEGVKND